ncbi:hypothetical protein DPEC_G00294250 [Dallia pectoralis]|uniref:Uncharacterized protein n=1 Tax=Dallia pectoralis TaxID=75939 RepID=A0ACC2FI91_DALPE|nr:hypothetical protein DPEC_G00294250 [Dallia pectoralis]
MTAHIREAHAVPHARADHIRDSTLCCTTRRCAVLQNRASVRVGHGLLTETPPPQITLGNVPDSSTAEKMQPRWAGGGRGFRGLSERNTDISYMRESARSHLNLSELDVSPKATAAALPTFDPSCQ